MVVCRFVSLRTDGVLLHHCVLMVCSQAALRNLSSFTDHRNQLLTPFRADVITEIVGYVTGLFQGVGSSAECSA